MGEGGSCEGMVDVQVRYLSAPARPHARPPVGYFEARYRVLRQPLGFPPSSAELDDDDNAIHAWVEAEAGEVVSVGRIHLIPNDSFGGCADTAASDAATCPDFPPLSRDGHSDAAGRNLPPPEDLRPAVQIRQMGTLPEHQRRGHAATILRLLEQQAQLHWGDCTGFLQARVAAIPFYRSQGWECFGPTYPVEGIGEHRSMWKSLRSGPEGDV